MKKISQREARSLRKRVYDLERDLDRQRNAWSDEWPGGVNVATVITTDVIAAILRTSRKLGHAVVATIDSGKPEVRYYALPLLRRLR